METEQIDAFQTPPPPPPPPPPRETESASETPVKAEDLDESMEDLKLSTDDAMSSSASLSDLKRKREEVSEEAIKSEGYAENAAKKAKGAESVSSTKINGIHKAEDSEMADPAETGVNGIEAKTAC